MSGGDGGARGARREIKENWMGYGIRRCLLLSLPFIVYCISYLIP